MTLAERVHASLVRDSATVAAEIAALRADLDHLEGAYRQALTAEAAAFRRVERGGRGTRDRWHQALDAVDLAFAALNAQTARIDAAERKLARLDRRDEFDRRYHTAQRLDGLRQLRATG